MNSRPMSNIDKQAGEGDVSPKTYYIHPMAFGSTKNPGYGHVAVVKAEEFEKLRAKLEAAEKRIAELEARQGVMRSFCKHQFYWDVSNVQRCARCDISIPSAAGKGE